MKKARLPESIHNTPNAKPHLWTNSRTKKLARILDKLPGRGTDINYWGVAKMVRHLIVNQAMRGFDSLRPSQSFLWCSSTAKSVRLVNGKM